MLMSDGDGEGKGSAAYRDALEEQVLRLNVSVTDALPWRCVNRCAVVMLLMEVEEKKEKLEVWGTNLGICARPLR